MVVISSWTSGWFTRGYILQAADRLHQYVWARFELTAGFQYYLIIPPVLLFLIPWSTKFKGIVASIYYIGYLTLFVFSYKMGN